MTLKDRIQKDLLDAMKAKEEVKVGALRMLKSAIGKFEVSGDKKKEASDEEVLQLIGKEVKQRKESIEAFKKGSREDLASKEEAEMKILQAYLPAKMSEDELRKVITQAISQTGAASKADFGKVMSGVMSQVKGRAEGAMVNKLVGELLK